MSDLFNKHIKKATARTKERLLEGLGKAKATQDEAFEFHAANLNKQSKACERLYKDLKGYSEALRKLTEAEKCLRESIRVAYEPEWPNRENLVILVDTLDSYSDALDKSVNDELTASVGTYVGQFAELKKKVEKRGRKMVDYDSAKHSFNSIKASSKKGDADPKLTKAFTELQQAETLYKEINGELLEILPATYDSRITFMVDTLQNLFNTQSLHQSECSKIHKQLVAHLDTLGNSMDSLRVSRPEALSTTPTREDSPTRSSDSPTSVSPFPTREDFLARSSYSPTSVPTSTPPQVSPAARFSQAETPKAVEEEKCEQTLYPKLAIAPPKKSEETKREEKKAKEEEKKNSTNPFEDSEDDEPEKLDFPVATSKLDRKVIHNVRSTHEYKAVDADELSFSAGELIMVLESCEDDQLDEGWGLGKKEDGTVGVFPENFTKKE